MALNVGFYLNAGGDMAGNYRCAHLLVRSLHAVMPGIPVTQFTDRISPVVADVYHVERNDPAPLCEARAAAFMRVSGDWLFLDTDVLIRQDVSAVFDRRFDVAVADRNWPHIEPTPALTAQMPYNAGVVFSRRPLFWREVLALVQAKGLGEDWMGDQWAIGQVADSGRYQRLVLPGMQFNYPPGGPSDRGEHGAAIVHFKGPRKRWMLGAAA